VLRGAQEDETLCGGLEHALADAAPSLPARRRKNVLMTGHLAAFLGVAVLVIVTPGPDTALTVRNTLLRGRAAGLATAVGVVCGQATWAIATSAGVAALLRASEPAFVAVKVAGAVYLVYLGGQAIVAALRGSREPPASAPRAPAARSPARTKAIAVRQGLVSNLTNPKMAAFFPSLLPQFAGGDSSFAALLVLGLVFCSLTLAWLSAYAIAVARLGALLRRRSIRRALEGVTGVALIALGLRLAGEQRAAP
jgi:threonine/homoserine/homoserine lactone efflux protein